MSSYGTLNISAEGAALLAELAAPPMNLLFRHLSASPLVSIAQIEGRVRGAGSEFVLACDMRFAASESAVFGQIEPAGQAAVKERVNAIALAPVDDFRRIPTSSARRCTLRRHSRESARR